MNHHIWRRGSRHNTNRTLSDSLSLVDKALVKRAKQILFPNLSDLTQQSCLEMSRPSLRLSWAHVNGRTLHNGDTSNWNVTLSGHGPTTQSQQAGVQQIIHTQALPNHTNIQLHDNDNDGRRQPLQGNRLSLKSKPSNTVVEVVLGTLRTLPIQSHDGQAARELTNWRPPTGRWNTDRPYINKRMEEWR